MTSGSPHLTNDSPEFCPYDIGKLVEVRGAAAGGGTLYSSIVDFVSSSEVILADSAAIAVTNAKIAYGADQYAALQCMLDSVGSVASTQSKTAVVFDFSTGIYMISQPLRVKQYLCKLSGNYSGLRMMGNDFAIRVDPDGSINNVHGVEIRDFLINSRGGGINARCAPQIEITNNHIKDFFAEPGTGVYGCGGVGIDLQGCVSAKVEANKIDGAGKQGIFVRSLNKTWTGGSAICESQGTIIARNRIYCTYSIALLVSEGGGHEILNNDIEGCGNGLEVRSSYDFSIKGNYFEANTADIQTRNLVDLVPARSIQCGLISDNTCESTTGISLVHGNNVIVSVNRISGAAYIAAAVTNTWWDRQKTVGSFSNGSTSTKRADLFN